MKNSNTLKVALAQISPVWLNKSLTIEKIKSYISDAADQHCELVVFGEAILPGYPFWLSLTDGTAFDHPVQKEIHAHYIRNSITPELGELDEICALAREKKIAVYLGLIERAQNRGRHSLYCSLAYINTEGQIKSMHRKLQPTYDERLAWSVGDGNGLRVHPLKQFTLGGLNCYENWMPMPRAALYGMGEDLHVAVWPGSKHLTEDITRFVAKESRSFVLSASGLMRKTDFPSDTPHLELILANAPETLANGGSCIAGPNGKWIIEPLIDKEGLFMETLDFNKVLEERQNFDPSGHYSRPDVLQLSLNRERQTVLKIEGEETV